MLSNLPVLRILKNQIMFTNFKKLYMVWNKLLELGMKDFQSFLWKKDFQEVVYFIFKET